MADDLDMPPASDDQVVQQYVDTNWREAVRGTRESMESLRRIYPELTQHLPETASRHIASALDSLQSASRQLHLSGPHVLGQEVYDEFIAAQTERQIRTR